MWINAKQGQNPELGSPCSEDGIHIKGTSEVAPTGKGTPSISHMSHQTAEAAPLRMSLGRGMHTVKGDEKPGEVTELKVWVQVK